MQKMQMEIIYKLQFHAGTPANTVITSPEFVINNAEDVYVDGSKL
ncbi:hypothetical protein MASR2M54_04480 [Aliarcobacter cryaerophilus]